MKIIVFYVYIRNVWYWKQIQLKRLLWKKKFKKIIIWKKKKMLQGYVANWYTVDGNKEKTKAYY